MFEATLLNLKARLRPNDPKTARAKFLKIFENNPNHQWITANDKLKKLFRILINMIPDEDMSYFLGVSNIEFHRASGKLGCAVSSIDKRSVIIVFPDLFKLLNSALPYHGLAVLAHELGHIRYQHSHKDIDPMQAQVEADSFAIKMGLGHELQDILLDEEQTIETQTRISYITSDLIVKERNLPA